ncbi:penicillin acylase family protein [Kitasatospora cystarginea]|uniref:penicillin acylase family protein n=1 Tax=Kitasatospora cystarginea TaxID=58350 RepID=UPI003CD064CA
MPTAVTRRPRPSCFASPVSCRRLGRRPASLRWPAADPPPPCAPRWLPFRPSFVMATELTPGGPRTRTVLAYGESANPASPHYLDQTVLFSHRQWVIERFTEAEITADPQPWTTTLHG